MIRVCECVCVFVFHIFKPSGTSRSTTRTNCGRKSESLQQQREELEAKHPQQEQQRKPKTPLRHKARAPNPVEEAKLLVRCHPTGVCSSNIGRDQRCVYATMASTPPPALTKRVLATCLRVGLVGSAPFLTCSTESARAGEKKTTVTESAKRRVEYAHGGAKPHTRYRAPSPPGSSGLECTSASACTAENFFAPLCISRPQRTHQNQTYRWEYRSKDTQAPMYTSDKTRHVHQLAQRQGVVVRDWNIEISNENVPTISNRKGPAQTFLPFAAFQQWPCTASAVKFSVN